MRPSPAFSISRGSPIYEISARHERHFRDPQRAHPNVARWVARTPVEEVGTSVIVLAEIRRGIELKRRSQPDAAKALDQWFALMRKRLGDRVLPIDEPIMEAWAMLSISNSLPLIDGLLAATAKVRGLMLVTRNIEDIAESGVAVFDPFSE
jgi:predicted nucleic acid-binding protein